MSGKKILSTMKNIRRLVTKKYLVLFIFLFGSCAWAISQNSPEHDLIISVERIWDRAAHNAFTGLVEFQDKLFCCFRESEGHVSDINGTIRVIASDDGQNWYSVAHIFKPGVDLRDPQLSVTPGNRIMLNMGGSIYINGKLEGMEPRVSFSDATGEKFSIPERVMIDDKIKCGKDWLWRTTWHHGKSYGTIYQPARERSLHLMVSDDGLNYQYITTLDVNGGNETTLRFTPDHRMIAIVRRSKNGYIGISKPPYHTWEWNELESRLGGPDLILLENDMMLCATREYPPDHHEKTILARVELNGKITKLLTLPSGGDCSYPGLLMKDSILHVSYYSSHEEKTAIYLARVLDLSYAYDGFERVPVPKISFDKNGVVELYCEDDLAEIIYTLNGTVPSAPNGYFYQSPIKIEKATMLRAIAIKDKFPSSRMLSRNVGSDIFQKPQLVERELQQGLKYEYHEGQMKNTLEIREFPTIKTGIVSNVTTSPKNHKVNYAFTYLGYIMIPEDGTYTFYLTSNDGSRLYINNELAINNDGAHKEREESVVVSLRKGYHRFLLDYYQLGGAQKLVLEWGSGSFERAEIPPSGFYHDEINF